MTDWTEQMDRARRVAGRAHAPYSGFHVGALVVASDGAVYEGCNVENAAYGSSICAEASAIAAGVTGGVSEIETVVVACPDGDGPCYPCGNCRQLMSEFGVTRVVVQDGGGGWIEHSFDEIFPHAFGAEDLE
jgi:cytidine deaminase